MYKVKYRNIIIGIIESVILLCIASFVSYIGILNEYILPKKIDLEIMSSRMEIITNSNGLYSKKLYYIVNNTEYVCMPNIYFSERPNDNNEIVRYYSKKENICETEYRKNYDFKFDFIFFYEYFIVFVVFIITIIYIINKIKEIKKVKKLSMNAILIKNVPYKKKVSSVYTNSPILFILNYLFPNKIVTNSIIINGQRYELIKNFDILRTYTTTKEGFIDVLIDESNPRNYYIDFDINRISGNLESDYYKETKK